MKYRTLIYLSFLLVLANSCCRKIKSVQQPVFTSRPDTLFLSLNKVDCDLKGYNLVVRESVAAEAQDFCNPFKYNLLFHAEKSKKIALLHKLLEYSENTMSTGIKVKCYSSTAYQKYGNTDYQGQLTINVMALYHINLICFGQYSVFKYCPYPILIDTTQNEIINDNIVKMREVALIYKEWVNRNTLSGFEKFSFPLLGTRYRWLHGDQNNILMFQLPDIQSDFKNRIGLPVGD